MTDGAEGRAKLLKAVIQCITLRDGEAEVRFQPPIDVLAEAGALLNNQNKWGWIVSNMGTQFLYESAHL
jgi:hypothetical protein